MLTKTLKMRPGYFLALEFSAHGGVSYRRATLNEEATGPGTVTDFNTRKTVDHIELNKQSNSIVQSAYSVLSKYAVSTPLGYWIDKPGLDKLAEDLRHVQENAESFCRRAADVGSARRVAIAIYPLALAEDNEIAAQRIAQDVRDRLGELHAAFKTGDRTVIKTATESVRHLEKLAVGVQADSIRLAQDHAKFLNLSLGRALRDGLTGDEWAEKADLEPIEAAIQMFTENLAVAA